jgi:hypothetical protein
MTAKLALCAGAVAVAILYSGSPAMAAGDRSERRAGQDSDELRTDIRQRRLKKVEDLDALKLPQPSAPAQPSKSAKPKGSAN